MKRIITFSLFLFVIIGFIILRTISTNVHNVQNKTEPGEKEGKHFFELDGHSRENKTVDDYIRISNEINSMPSEVNAVNSWRMIGPTGAQVIGSATSKYSGRIDDIELLDGGNTIRLAPLTGGLWQISSNTTTTLTDSLGYHYLNRTFATKPGNNNDILVGSGWEGYQSLYRTTNGGLSWFNVTMPTWPQTFNRIRYSPSNSNIVYASTAAGFFRSTDAGSNWVLTQTGSCTFYSINPVNTNIIYCPIISDGLYKSTNGGINFSKITTGGIPTANYGWTSVSIAPSNPSIVYVNIEFNNSTPSAIYKTTNDGLNWTNITPTITPGGICSVCPTDPNRVLAGFINLLLTTNGGNSWTDVTSEGHVDQHSIAWLGGNTVYLGNDGGLFVSTNGGLNWSSSLNTLPISQFYYLDVANNGNYIYGGTQDNGIIGTTNGGSNWYSFLGGDGSGVAIDPTTPSKIVAVNGYWGGGLAFQRQLTTNSGLNWVWINNGIEPSEQWFTSIRNDVVSPVELFSQAGTFSYRSTNYGTNWTKLNTTAFPANIYGLTVTRYVSPHATVYCTFDLAGPVVKVYDNNNWYDRVSGLPTTGFPRKIAVHQTNVNYGYALIRFGAAGQKVYKTTNKGINWTNVTGDLPNVNVCDLVTHPTDNNNLYLGSESGCFKTTNGGVNWLKWMNGMPKNIWALDMKYIDSTSIGKFYIVVASYGRSFWTREISGDDPITFVNNETEAPRYGLYQNYPNPFNPTTNISYAISKNSFVKLVVFDILGREVETLVNEKKQAGTYETTFNASQYSSGVYFYKIYAGDYSEIKKMLLIK